MVLKRIEPTEGDRTMLSLALRSYEKSGFEVYVLEFEGGEGRYTLGYHLRGRNGATHEFRLQKFNKGILKKLWIISHARSGDIGFSYSRGLANALGECEKLMDGRSPSFSSMEEVARAALL